MSEPLVQQMLITFTPTGHRVHLTAPGTGQTQCGAKVGHYDNLGTLYNDAKGLALRCKRPGCKEAWAAFNEKYGLLR